MIEFLNTLFYFQAGCIAFAFMGLCLGILYIALLFLQRTYGWNGQSIRSQIARALDDIEDHSDRMKRYFRTIRGELRVLLWVCIALLFVGEVVVAPSLGSLPRLNAIIGLVSSIAGAYVTGLVIYFAVTHWQRESDKEALQDHIGPLAQGILDHARQMMWPLIENTRYDRDSELDVLKIDRRELIGMLERFDANPNVHGLVMGDPATVNDWVNYHVNESKRLVSELFVHYTMLDTSLVRLLNEISCSDLHRMGDMPIMGCKPSWLADNIWTYFQRLRPLERYLADFPGKRAFGPTDEERWAREHDMRLAMGITMNDLGIKPDPDLSWKIRKFRKANRKAARQTE